MKQAVPPGNGLDEEVSFLCAFPIFWLLLWSSRSHWIEHCTFHCYFGRKFEATCEWGFKLNPEDSCMEDKKINRSQSAIIGHMEITCRWDSYNRCCKRIAVGFGKWGTLYDTWRKVHAMTLLVELELQRWLKHRMASAFFKLSSCMWHDTLRRTIQL